MLMHSAGHFARLVPISGAARAHPDPHALDGRKPLIQLNKNGLSTQTAALYYYDYL